MWSHIKKKRERNNLTMTTLDLDCKIVFKVKLADEIRKTVIHNEEINFNELQLMIQSIFSDKIKPNDEFTMKYTDEGKTFRQFIPFFAWRICIC